MYQIRENDEELNNSFENVRKTIKKPKSLDDFDGEENDNIKSIIKDKNMTGDQVK